MTTQPPVNPSDAPFVAGVVPMGWDTPMTQEQADAANALYPVPPYGSTYFPPGPPPVPPPSPPNVVFLRLDNVVQGLTTQANFRNEDEDKVEVDDIIVIWPIAGVLGIVDDVGTRPVRVLTKADEKITFNFDSTGLDVSGLILVAVKYVGP